MFLGVDAALFLLRVVQQNNDIIPAKSVQICQKGKIKL